MRRLGTLGEEAARRFAEAVRGRGIPTELRPDAGGAVSVWVIDEDRVDAAKLEWTAFEKSPDSERFPPVAARPPEREVLPAASADPSAPRGPVPVWRRVPVTLVLVVLSIVATLASDFGEMANRVTNALSLASYVTGEDTVGWNGLDDLRSGQIWRLFTPIFMHGGLIHLLGNIGALWVLGGAVESVRGSARMLGLVLIIAAASNFAEYWLNFGFTFDAQNGFKSDIAVSPSPFFLGMSGVVFGLFGFVWMRARFVPGSRFLMPRDLVVWMLIWLLACTAGLVGAIANVAHGVGLLVGMAIGIAPRLWRRG